MMLAVKGWSVPQLRGANTAIKQVSSHQVRSKGRHLPDVVGLDQVDVIVCLIRLHDGGQVQHMRWKRLATHAEYARLPIRYRTTID